jgi:hypothetical protein
MKRQEERKTEGCNADCVCRRLTKLISAAYVFPGLLQIAQQAALLRLVVNGEFEPDASPVKLPAWITGLWSALNPGVLPWIPADQTQPVTLSVFFVV